MARSSGLDRMVRKWVPSTAVLSQSAPFRLGAGVLDVLTRPLLRLYTDRPIPPLRYMVRTGVGNRVVFPHLQYLTVGFNQWLYFFAQGWARLDSTIVDIGSGAGKSALALRDFRYAGQRFRGRYVGFDVDRAMVEWCARHFPAPEFRFVHIDMPSTVYNAAGGARAPCLDLDDAGADFVLSQSLFSHLLEDDLAHYLRESRRVLRPGGVMAMTFFCLEDLEAAGRLGGRWRFEHTIGRARVENLRFPEAAVAYARDDVLEITRAAGFAEADVILPHYQSTLWARR